MIIKEKVSQKARERVVTRMDHVPPEAWMSVFVVARQQAISNGLGTVGNGLPRDRLRRGPREGPKPHISSG